MNKKVVDCFIYHNEAELLELRVRCLESHVDQFVIIEASHTHSGKPRQFQVKNLVEKLKLPAHKIRVVEFQFPEHPVPNDHDLRWARESGTPQAAVSWTRERLQRDAITDLLDDYDDNTVFMLSDCDEIIKPSSVEYFTDTALKNPSVVLGVPLVMLEGSADRRLYENQTPVSWRAGLFLALKRHLRTHTPTTIKTGASPYSRNYITQDDRVLEDQGWHFTWMGDQIRKKDKSESFIHHAKLESSDTASPETLKNLGHNQPRNYSVRDYDITQLPKEIFEHKHLEEFLFPNGVPDVNKPKTFSINKNARSTAWIVDNFYDDPHAVRQFALEQEYLEGGIGRGFIGRRTHEQFLFPGLKERFEEIIGRPITAWQEHGMNGRFQIAWAGEPLVYHCDAQKWAGMLYLTPDAPWETGTTLWAHRNTRARHNSEPDLMRAFETGTHLDRTPYDPVDVLGNVFNRLTIFEAGHLHSASEYFGSESHNARLWQMFFFD